MEQNTIWSYARRIWKNDGVREPHQYCCFRKRFDLSHDRTGLQIRISADTDFILYLDGAEVARGQFPDYPAHKTWTDVLLGNLNAGSHLIAILVYYCGADFAVYTPGVPGVIVRLSDTSDWQLVSDASWRVLPHTAFRNGEMPKLTPQLGFTTEYDARQEIGWQQPEFDDSYWPMAVATNPAQDLPPITYEPRPAGARPRLLPFHGTQLVRQGVMMRRIVAGPVAMQMMADQLFFGSPETVIPNFSGNLRLDGGANPLTLRCPYEKTCDGVVVIADLGEELVGFVEFEVNAPAGTIIDYAHGEHLDDGRVRAEIFQRNFADRYICREGRNVFQLPFRRIGARYLELHITGFEPGSVTLYRLGVRPWELELPEAADFDCEDAQLLAVRKLAIRTLELCMHEHYEDCPWREQALYTYDSRNQMLYGYYLWGNGDFAAASLNLWRDALRKDGHLRLCAPSNLEIVIPIYSLVWIAQVWEHWLYTGSDIVFRRNHEALAIVVNMALEHQDRESGLYFPGSDQFWNFYEWAPELSRHTMEPGEFHALYNLYLIETLDVYACMLDHAGESVAAETYRQRAASLRIRVDQLFYDVKRGVYASRIIDGKLVGLYHEHTQVMMLHTGSVPETKKKRMLNALYAEELVELTLSAMPYLMFALLRESPEGRTFICHKLKKNYYPMLNGESTNLWETVNGGDDFLYAASLCHGWSSLPVYYCAAGVLGVIPLEPGFKRYRISPWDGGLSYASGTIPTPSGNLQVRWKKNSAGRLDLTVETPPDLEPEVVELPESPIGIVKFVNGKIQRPAKVLFESLRPNPFLREEYAT